MELGFSLGFVWILRKCRATLLGFGIWIGLTFLLVLNIRIFGLKFEFLDENWVFFKCIGFCRLLYYLGFVWKNK